MSTRTRVLAVCLLLSAATLAISSPSDAVTQAEVDAACAEHREAHERLDQATKARDEATEHSADLYAQLDVTRGREARLSDQIKKREAQAADRTNQIREQVAELYMDAAGGTVISTSLFLETQNAAEPVLLHEYQESVATIGLSSIDHLLAIQSDTKAQRDEQAKEASRLTVLEREAQEVADDLIATRQVIADATSQLGAECRRLYDQQQTELAKARALEAARRSGGAGGVPPSITPDFFCPMSPATSSFINDWGFPRSGGRTHKGTDLFARKGEPVFAVGNGTIAVRNGGLGGLAIWLSADHGVDYYYAHLDGYASGISQGARVSRGQTIAFNGNSGNARGTAPHLHFQLHPGGRTSRAVNPYPTLLSFSCR